MSLNYPLKTLVDDETGEAFRRRASANGCGLSDLLRDAVYMIEHGMTFGEYVAKHRRQAIGFIVPAADQERAE